MSQLNYLAEMTEEEFQSYCKEQSKPEYDEFYPNATDKDIIENLTEQREYQFKMKKKIKLIVYKVSDIDFKEHIFEFDTQEESCEWTNKKDGYWWN